MTEQTRAVNVGKVAAIALVAVLAGGVSACSPGAPPRPGLKGGVRGTCQLFWTYQSARGVPDYPSFAAAYQADMAEYGHPRTPGYVSDIMPYLEPTVRISATSSVDIGSIEVVFYDKTGAETSGSRQIAVNEILRGGQGYTPDTAVLEWALSDPETGDTSVASCAVAAWTRRDPG